MAALTFTSNAQIAQQDRQQAQAIGLTAQGAGDQARVVSQLAGYVRRCFDEAVRGKDQDITHRLVDCLRRRKGEYDPTKLLQIRQMGGSEIFMMLTDVKCRAAESWVKDVLLPVGDRPWELQPTPIPDVNPELAMEVTMVVQQEMQMLQAMGSQIHPAAFLARANQLFDEAISNIKHVAKKRGEKMSDKIQDQMIEGGWRGAFDDFLTDFCTFPTAFIKGPIRVHKRVLSWGLGWQPIVENKLVWSWKRVSPFDLYFSPSLQEINRGYVIERIPYTRQELADMIGVPGYDAVAIRKALIDFQRSGFKHWLMGDEQRRRLEDKVFNWISPTDTIDALEYSGPVPGQMLIDWGMSPAVIDAALDYEASVVVIGPHTIKAVLNPDPLQRRLYTSASFEKVPGSIWGRAIPESMADVQDATNGAARALMNNMAIGSGPMVGVAVDRMADGEKVTKLHPWRIFQMKSSPNHPNNLGVEFFMPETKAGELLTVMESFAKKADEVTGIPNYVYGMGEVGGGGKTASGLSMLMGAASKGIKQAIFHIDIGVIESQVERQYHNNMLYEDDPEIKGDLQVKARGANALLVQDMMVQRRKEFLAETNNPVDLTIVGLEGRAEVLGEVVKSLDMDPERIVPPREVVQQRAMMAAQQQAQAQAEEQAGPGGKQGNKDSGGGKAAPTPPKGAA